MDIQFDYEYYRIIYILGSLDESIKNYDCRLSFYLKDDLEPESVCSIEVVNQQNH